MGRERSVFARTIILAAVAAGCPGAPVAAQEADMVCRSPAHGPAADTVLRSVMDALGIPENDLLLVSTRGRTVEDFQSDRSYPPFFSLMDEVEEVYDPRDGSEHVRRSIVYPGLGPTPPVPSIGTEQASYSVRDSVVPMERLHGEMQDQRVLNPWAVTQDWVRNESGVGFAGTCRYRDQWRMVLQREGSEGPQRLYVDEDSRLPVKLDWTVPHATWGQRHMEALWSTWIAVGDGSYLPSASFLLADGRVVRERTVGQARLVASDAEDAPHLERVPADTPPMAVDRMLAAWIGPPPDTVRVAEDTYLLAHPAYNEVVTLAGDTVVVLDATLGEERARADSTWIARLFPGSHPVKVVVTDLAWPHIGGVRFWVARGATIVSHRQSESFLRELVERHWTLRPDALERTRADQDVPFHFQAIDDGGRIGNDDVALTHIDGIGAEGALMAWLPEADFLWAGDFIQDLSAPSLYAGEVMRAAHRIGVRPGRFAAQHTPLAPWSAVEAANPVTTSEIGSR